MHNPYIAIVAAALAAWIFGAIWYGVLGKAWHGGPGPGSGRDRSQGKGQKCRYRPMAMSFVSELVMAVVFS